MPPTKKLHVLFALTSFFTTASLLTASPRQDPTDFDSQKKDQRNSAIASGNTVINPQSPVLHTNQVVIDRSTLRVDSTANDLRRFGLGRNQHDVTVGFDFVTAYDLIAGMMVTYSNFNGRADDVPGFGGRIDTDTFDIAAVYQMTQIVHENFNTVAPVGTRSDDDHWGTVSLEGTYTPSQHWSVFAGVDYVVFNDNNEECLSVQSGGVHLF